MKLRDTVILVVLAHVGLVLVWICMGGCANNKSQETKKEVAAITSTGEEMDVVPTEVTSRGPAMPIAIEPEPLPAPGFSLPETRVSSLAPAPAKPAEPLIEPSPEEIKYVVKPGDTLWGISRRFKTSVSAITDRNDIQNPNLIRPGRELIIPVAATPQPATLATTAEAAAALPAGSEAIPVAEDAQNAMHRVQPGDTVWKLARVYNTTSTAILEANNITDPTKIRVGQELRIPKGE
jgi:LysM repeat protein